MNDHKLIQHLQKCASYCLWCSDKCLDEDNLSNMIDCIRTDRTCAETCNAAANLLSMQAPNASELVKLCQDICEKCADECSKHDHHHCKECAEACRECAKACAEYAAA